MELIDEPIDVETELLEHLAVPESAMVIYREQIDCEMLLRDEKAAATLLPFVIDYIEKHSKAPTAPQIIHEMGGYFEGPTTPVDWVVEQLRERYQKNRAKDVVSRLASLALSDPDEAVRFGLEQFGEIARKTASHSGILDLGDWDRAISVYNNRILSGQHKGFSSGFAEMDEVTGGLRPNTMTFVCGRPKTCKSWVLLKAAVVNMLAGANVHFETMELREDEMYGRFQCMVAGVSYSKFFKGRLTGDEIEEMRRIGELLSKASGTVRFVHPVPEERTVRHVAERAKAWDADIVLGDQFSFITPTSKDPVKHQRDAVTVYEIKDYIASQWPTFWAAQFNREASSLTEMADLSQIGLTDAIGQASDLVLGIHANKEMRESRMFELGIIASRVSETVRGLVSNQIGTSGDLKWIEQVSG